MASIHELIGKIENPDLRNQIEAEVNKLAKQKKFGLVFEEHLPECTPLYDIPVKVGSLVALKAGKVSETYKVLKIDGESALCVKKDGNEPVTFAVDDLVSVAEFGEPIYPYLKPLDSVCNAPDSSLWHTLIEADNYHALQLLEYLYAGKVDCIYIDPPYNTGARDWKYNNDYVDGNDSFRHSKWLSMMQKRLILARKLLKDTGIIVVTIDDYEYATLKLLLDEIFSVSNYLGTVIIRNNPSGRSTVRGLSVNHEYAILYSKTATARLGRMEHSEDQKSRYNEKDNIGYFEWENFRKNGTDSDRADRPKQFYPVFLNTDSLSIRIPSVTWNDDIGEYDILEEPLGNEIVLLPKTSSGDEKVWKYGIERAKKDSSELKAKKTKQGYELYRKKYINTEGSAPHTWWDKPNYSARDNGTRMLTNILGSKNAFDFPKALDAVRDSLTIANLPQDGLVVDFFAGSGTTLQAVNLMNRIDNGSRRCILVTNNEVSETDASTLSKKGISPGTNEWDKHGIARSVTWRRTVCSIEGVDVYGNALKGNYCGKDYPLSDGFKANVAFFKLGFLDKTSVALGRQFKEMLPTLWMKAGAIGKCPNSEERVPDILILPDNNMAILNDEKRFGEFKDELEKYPEIKTVYLVTDYEPSFVSMTQALRGRKTHQLYRDYLENFRINAGRNGR